MKLFELMRQIQDACLNDGNLEKEVTIIDKSTGIHEEKKAIGVESNHPNQLHILVEE